MKDNFNSTNSLQLLKNISYAYFGISNILVFFITLLNRKNLKNRSLTQFYWTSNVDSFTILKYAEQPQLRMFLSLMLLFILPNVFAVYLIGIPLLETVLFLLTSIFISFTCYKLWLALRMIGYTILKSELWTFSFNLILLIGFFLIINKLFNMQLFFIFFTFIALFLIASYTTKKFSYRYVMLNATTFPIKNRKNKSIQFSTNQISRYIQFEYCRLLRNGVLLDYLIVLLILLISLVCIHLFVQNDLKFLVENLLVSFGLLDICILFPISYALFFKKNKFILGDSYFIFSLSTTINLVVYSIIGLISLGILQLPNIIFTSTILTKDFHILFKIIFYILSALLFSLFISDVLTKETSLFLLSTFIIFFVELILSQIALKFMLNLSIVYIVSSSLFFIFISKTKLFTHRSHYD
ncbi:hypothetical protein RV15_GL000780 [Enterococcus silesiacus]|nr:hypothetical protein RV15_GL000780 [Enterococcus silesiacus]